MVAAGHYLAAAAGLEILRRGGNAIDAGVAMGFCCPILEPHQNGLGGESPILIHHARSGRVVAVNGQGVAPQAATIDWFRQQQIDSIPGDGLLPATVPSTVDNYVTALAQFGTLSLEEVVGPALELASNGFPLYHSLLARIRQCADCFRDQWPSTGELYLRGGQVPQWGDSQTNPGIAAVLQQMIAAERSSATRGRVAGLDAARDLFYTGWPAEQMAEFARDTRVQDATGRTHSGLLAYDDLSAYRAKVENTVSVEYHGLQVHKCSSWSQGPVFCQQLRLLNGFDLESMGHNQPDYVHTWIECAKLAFADRECHYGDPEFSSVPLQRLLSPQYAAERRVLVDPLRASLELRPGDLPARSLETRAIDPGRHGGDTTGAVAVDADGNMIAITPSGGWIHSSPVIPALGFPLGTRGQMFSLDADHPNALQPGKRPRTTLSPSLVMRSGRPWMVFQTPGGDQQDQWTLQFFLNLVHFQMGVQQALDAPLFHSEHFPASFYPHNQSPGRVVIEERIPAPIRAALADRGHDVHTCGAWELGRVMGIRFDEQRGLVYGGASARGETAYAQGW